MSNIISDWTWRTIQETVKESNLAELLNIYNVNNLDYNAKGGEYNRTVLHEAAEQDKQKIVGYLIQHGAKVNTKDNIGYNPLHFAVRNNSVDVAKLLLEKGAEVNTKDNNGVNPLHEAARNNSVDVAKLLLENGAEVNTKNNNGVNPLHFAASNNSVDVAKLLLENGAEVNTKNNNGVNPLHFAVRNNSVDVAKLLLEKGAEVNTKDNNGVNPLHEAARNNSVDVAKLLLENGAEVNTKDNNGNNPLHEAVRNNSVDVAKLLLEEGAEVNTKDNNGDNPLHVAASNNSVDVAKLLLENGAEVNTKNKYGNNPLHVAASNNSVDVAKLLLENGAEVNTKDNNGDNPLHFAARNNSVDVAKLLLEEGAEVNTKDNNGDNPLHFAVRNNRVELVKLLLEKGAEVNTKDNNGDNPLYVAARNNSIELAKLLLEEGAEVNTKNNNGDNPLHFAVRNNRVELAKLLLEKGVEVNTKNNNGDNPLHFAVRYNRVELAKLLLEKGAEVSTKDNNGEHLLHVAVRDNSVELAKLLLEEGAEVNTKDINGNNPLHVAARNNSVDVAILLIEEGADISTIVRDNESCLQYMQKSWSNNVLQHTFRNGVQYSNPALIVNELEIKDDFDDDVKKILRNILKEAIDKLPGIINNPEHRFVFYRGDLYVTLVKEFLERSGETTLLHTIYIALQAKTHCNQSKRKMLEDGLGSDIYDQFRSEIKELADDVVAERTAKELNVIAQQIYTEYMKDKTGLSYQVVKYCSKAWRNAQDFLKSSFQRLELRCRRIDCCLKCCCRNVNCSFCLPNLSEVYHSCSAIGMMGTVSCILGIAFYILDLYTDVVVGISDFKGFSQKLGIFEIALVSFTLAHENIRSAESAYTTEEEVLRIKFGRFMLSAKDWSESKLRWSENRFKMFVYKLSCPFKLQGSILSKLKATLYNLLTFVQLRPVVDRLVIFLHAPISLREYHRRQAEQNSLKQFYLILEQLPELLVQFYTFQILINNLSPRDIGQFAGECYHYFDYQRMNTNNTNDTNLFCENLSLSDTGLGTCGTVFRIFSMAIPFYNIPSGIASLEDGFRKLDPLTPKMSTILKVIFQATYTLMIPARLFMFAAVMHAVFIKEYVFGFIIFRVIMELLVNLYVLKSKFKGLSIKNVSILWRMVLFSIRDVFLISIRNPDAYLSKPSDVSYTSLRKRKNLAVRAVPFICEGLVAALIIEQRYPCGKHFNYFKYLGWFCIIPLVLSVSAMVMVSDLYHPFKGRSSSLVKETKKLLLAGFISIMIMGVVVWTFIVSQNRGSLELLIMGLVVFLYIVLVAGLCLYLKISNKSKETPFTPVAMLTTSGC